MAEYINIYPIEFDGENHLSVEDDRGEGAGGIGLWLTDGDGNPYLRIQKDDIARWRSCKPEISTL